MPNGRVANGIRRTTAFEPGLIRTSRASTRSEVQTEPPAERTIPDWAPTWTFAIGASGAGAADAQATATPAASGAHATTRSEEHTSELQSRPHLVCRLLLEKK